MISGKSAWITGLVGLLALTLLSCGPTPTAAKEEAQPRNLRPSAAALQAGGEAMPRTITVSGIGKATARPDVAEIQLGVETVSEDPGLAISENTERMTAVMDVVKAMGVEDKDVQTVKFSMWVEEERDREGRLTGVRRYHVVNHIRVRLHDLDKTGEFLRKALEAGANNVGGITFRVSDPEALERQARDLAIANAKAKAEQLATGLGAKLGPLRQVSEFGGVVTPRAAPMGAVEKAVAAAPVPVSGGEFSVTVQIQVVFDIAE